MSDGGDSYPRPGFPHHIRTIYRISGDEVTEQEAREAAWAAHKEGRDVRETLEEVVGDG